MGRSLFVEFQISQVPLDKGASKDYVRGQQLLN
jgi:hypothetical protein